jgi:hypothetical protein
VEREQGGLDESTSPTGGGVRSSADGCQNVLLLLPDRDPVAPFFRAALDGAKGCQEASGVGFDG